MPLLVQTTTYSFMWKQRKNLTEMYLPIPINISDDSSYSGHAHGKNIGSITAYGSGNKKHAVFSIAVGRPISWSLKIMLFYLFSFSIMYIITFITSDTSIKPWFFANSDIPSSKINVETRMPALLLFAISFPQEHAHDIVPANIYLKLG